jgi:hypothetical protein
MTDSIREGGGPWGTVPELLFEKKGLTPEIQKMLVSNSTADFN